MFGHRIAFLCTILELGLLGCGARVESNEVAPSAPDDAVSILDAIADGGEGASDAEIEDTSPPAPYDGSPERCTGRGNYVYAYRTDASGASERVLEPSTFNWRVDQENLYWISLTAFKGGWPEGYFDFVNRNESDVFKVGVYEPAKADFPVPGRLGLGIKFKDSGIACLNDRGRFQIHKLEWIAGPTSTKPKYLSRFLVTFEQRCELFTISGCLNFER